MIALDELRNSFEGVVPSIIATSAPDGTPNISYLSHVYYVDERHVALSNQFFSKTAGNVQASGLATVLVVDGRSGQQHVLDLAFVRSEPSGELFDRVAAHLKVSSASQGLEGLMMLRAVDIYRVEHCRAIVPVDPLADIEPLTARRDRLGAAMRLTQALAARMDAEAMLDCALEGLDAFFGFANAVVLVPDGEGRRLSTIASRGYAPFGVGSEIAFGEGAIGVAAETERPVRISDTSRGHRYAAAIRQTAGGAGAPIPFPRLAGARSQLAVPMLSRGRLSGVLFVESEKGFAFTAEDEAALSIIASQLATGLQLVETERVDLRATLPETSPSAPVAALESFRLRYYPLDGTVLIDGDYLIRGVPGRLLHHFVSSYLASGRRDFSNREIRRDTSLRLPDFKDNLETRLLLLRRRLDEKEGPIRLSRPQRGQIRLDLRGTPTIEIAADV